MTARKIAEKKLSVVKKRSSAASKSQQNLRFYVICQRVYLKTQPTSLFYTSSGGLSIKAARSLPCGFKQPDVFRYVSMQSP